MWLTEFVGSLLILCIPKIFGHGQIGASIGWMFHIAFYFVLLPFFYLVNDSDVKNAMVEDSWYRPIKGIFSRTSVEVLPK